MKVYFVKPRDADGPIKVGIASHLPSRLSTLFSGSPVQLELIIAIDGDIDLERSFHALFMPHRSHGEWFHAAPLVVETVAAVIDGTFNFDGLPEPKRIKAAKRDNSYVTPRWRYGRSVAARIMGLRSRGMPRLCNEAQIHIAIGNCSEEDFPLIRQEVEAILAEHEARFPPVRRRRAA